MLFKFLMRYAVANLAFLSLLWAPILHAQPTANYPERPIKIVVPFGAGSSPDAVARILERSLSQKLGVTIIVENRAGAAGNIGAEFAARSQNDGYTLMLAGTNIAVAGSIYKNLRFDVKRDFAPVGMIGSVPSVLVVSTNSKLQSIAELVRYAKTNPGKVTFASSGTGTTSHLAGELFNRMANVQMVHVPYPAAGRALMDIASGRVDLLFDNLPASVVQIKGGVTRALGIASLARNLAMPDVATIDESGYKGFVVEPWYGLMVPKGTPEPIVKLLNTHLRAILTDSDSVEKLQALGLKLVVGSPDLMGSIVESEMIKWGQVVRDANIQIE